MKIYILSNNRKETGPYSVEEIFSLLKQRQMRFDALARFEHEEDWRPLRELFNGVILEFQSDRQQSIRPAWEGDAPSEPTLSFEPAQPQILDSDEPSIEFGQDRTEPRPPNTPIGASSSPVWPKIAAFAAICLAAGICLSLFAYRMQIKPVLRMASPLPKAKGTQAYEASKNAAISEKSEAIEDQPEHSLPNSPQQDVSKQVAENSSENPGANSPRTEPLPMKERTKELLALLDAAGKDSGKRSKKTEAQPSSYFGVTMEQAQLEKQEGDAQKGSKKADLQAETESPLPAKDSVAEAQGAPPSEQKSSSPTDSDQLQERDPEMTAPTGQPQQPELFASLPAQSIQSTQVTSANPIQDAASPKSPFGLASATLSSLLGKKGQRTDYHPFSPPDLSEKDLVDILNERFRSAPIKILPGHGDRVDPGLHVVEGSFTLDTHLKWNPKVEVIYSIPMRGKVPGPHASNIVLMGFWPGAVTPPPYESDALLSPVDFVKFSSFLGRLKAQGDPLSEFLWNRLPEKSRKILENPKSKDQQGTLITELNAILRHGTIYDENRLSTVRLSPATEEILSQNPEGAKLVWMNRMILEDAYSSEVRRKPKELREHSRLYRYLDYYSAKLGYTAFTFHAVTNREMLSDENEPYYNGGPEWVDVVFRAQDEIARICKLRPRKLLMTGISYGGRFVERIAAARPERVGAVAVHCAPEIVAPQKPSNTAWFLGITRGDSMRSDYDQVANGLVKFNDNLVFSVFPPDYTRRGLYHYEAPIADIAAKAFLRGVVESYDSSGNYDVTRWPFVRDRSKPLRILPASSPAVSLIPVQNREYLPSNSFAQCIQSLSVPIQTLSLTGSDRRSYKCKIALPPLGKPKGVLVYCEDPSIHQIENSINNICFLADRGYVVFAPSLQRADSDAIRATFNLINRTPILDRLPQVSLGVNEMGHSLWDVVATQPGASPNAVAFIGFEGGDAFDESKLPVGSKIKCPILFVYDEKKFTNVSDPDQALEALLKVHGINRFVEKCRERHQPARAMLVPKETKNENAVAQRSVDYVNNIFTDIIQGHNKSINAL